MTPLNSVVTKKQWCMLGLAGKHFCINKPRWFRVAAAAGCDQVSVEKQTLIGAH